MYPKRVFSKKILENREICNYCFRQRARATEVPEHWPDISVPRYYPTESSFREVPPPRTDEMGQTISSNSPKFSNVRIVRDDQGDYIETELSRPTIICECGRIDDEMINGGFPEDWESRPKEKLLDVSRRVYHRLDEQGFNLDFDDFKSRVEHYKSSDEYEFGDYEVLQDAVADAVSVKQQEI